MYKSKINLQTMKSTPIKTGILSYGMSGKIFHSPFLLAHSGFEWTAVVERSKKQAQSQFPHIKSYDSVDELLADSDIELVVVNTPNATHFEFAKHAIEAGKHVLVEKPLTVTSDQAKQLFELGRQHNRLVLTYQNRRFDSDLLTIRRVIESGQLGRLVECHFRYDRYRHHIGGKKHKENVGPGAGLMYDLAPHLLDAVISLFGQPLSWTKTLGQFRPETQVDDYAQIHLIFPNNLQVFLTMTLLALAPEPAFLIHGTKGTFVKSRSNVQEKQLQSGMSPTDPNFAIEDSTSEASLTTISENGEITEEKIVASRSSYLDLFEAVYQTIRHGKAFPIKEEQVILQLEILEN